MHFALCIAAVTAAAALPSGYTQYTYIKGNGENARIVLDDYTPTPNYDKIEAVVEFPSLDQTMTVWCARGSSTTTATWTMFMLNNGGYKLRFDYSSTVDKFFTPALSANTKYTVTADGHVGTWTGGTGATHTKVADFTAGGPLALFASYYNGVNSNLGNYGKHRLYSFKVWRSGTLIHDLVPAVRESDVKKGLYDVTADKFYAATGTFTMGDPVGTETCIVSEGTESYAVSEFASNVLDADFIRRYYTTEADDMEYTFFSRPRVGTFLFMQ